MQGSECYVRFGSIGDIGAWLVDVRFTPKSGHLRLRIWHLFDKLDDLWPILNSTN